MKYRLMEETNSTLTTYGIVLHRIQALRDFGDVKEGDLGGWIEKERNLSQEGKCWVYCDAHVYGNALVSENAMVLDDARVYGKACVGGNARVYRYARVCDEAKVYGEAQVYKDAIIRGNAHVYGNARVYGGANVYGNARVYGFGAVNDTACVSENAMVLGYAYVSGDSYVKGNAIMSGEAEVYGDTIISAGSWNKTPLQIDGSIFPVNMITPEILMIGCEEHTIPTWLKDYGTIAAEHDITDEAMIEEYYGYIKKFAEKYCPEALKGA